MTNTKGVNSVINHLKGLVTKYQWTREFVNEKQGYHISMAKQARSIEEKEIHLNMSSRMSAESLAYKRIIEDLMELIKELEAEFDSAKEES